MDTRDLTADDCARLKHEAREHRAQARRLDDLARARRQCCDPIAALRYSSAARERRLLAKQADRARQDWASQQRVARILRRYQMTKSNCDVGSDSPGGGAA